MKCRTFFAVAAVFVFVFSLTLGFHSGIRAGENPTLNCDDSKPNQCDCCEEGNVAGTLVDTGPPGGPVHYVCTCTGCSEGPYGNPCNCPLFCAPQQ